MVLLEVVLQMVRLEYFMRHSSLTQGWSNQRFLRGWGNDGPVVMVVSGRSFLEELHLRQRTWRLAGVSGPPRLRGWMWSMVRGFHRGWALWAGRL